MNNVHIGDSIFQLKNVIRTNRRVSKGKKEKIISIQEATCMLISTKGYENVTIRNIAEVAGVSIGLIHKYFTGDKFDILKEISSRNTGELLMTKKPQNIDFKIFRIT